MGEVITLDCPTSLEISVDLVLEAAKEAGLQNVVILGVDQDDEEYFATSFEGKVDILWLLERMKNDLLRDK